jgi:alpha-beta hydrolase superfamily lysophospholipase
MHESRSSRASKRLVLRLGRIAALLIVLWLLVSAVVVWRLTRRPRAKFKEPAPQVAWGLVEEHRLHTVDGEDVGSWYVRGKPESPSVLVLHGNKGSRWNSLRRAEFLVAAGYSVLMISLRAHGDSTGDYNDIGYSARHDVIAAVEFLEQDRPGKPIVILGTSLGSAAATFASAELGHRVDAYILESPYRDLKTAVWNRTVTYLPPLLAQVAYAGLRSVGPVFLPHLDEISPVRAIRGIPARVPVLIIAGEADPLAMVEEARALLSQVAAHGQLQLFPGASHNNLFSTAPNRYRQAVLEFCSAVSSGNAMRW